MEAPGRVGAAPWLKRPDRPAAPSAEPAARPLSRWERFSDLAPLIEAMPDPVLLIDLDTRIAAANAPARRRWGLAYDAAGRVMDEAERRWGASDLGVLLVRVLRQDSVEAAARAALEDGVARTVEFSETTPVEEHFRCTASPIDWNGAKAALLVFSDITAQIVAERMRAEFVANASHELKTPLTALTMALETASGAARDNAADRERFIGMVHAHAERMARLIDDLLSLSRIELDEHVRPSGRADIVEILEDAVEWAAPLAAKRGVRLELKAHAESLMVIGDRVQIAQVAQNLIDNARKYSPENAVVEIEIGIGGEREEALDRAGKRWADAGRFSMVTPLAPGRTYAFFRVADAGPGIKRRHLPKLGERFFRVAREEGEAETRPGTGLGLAIVKHIVNRHRGGLVVESVPGKGAAFGVYLERPAVVSE